MTVTTSVESATTDITVRPLPLADGIPLNVRAGMDKAADAFRKHGSPTATGLDAGKIDWRLIGKEGDVAQLDKAEALAQDAFKRLATAGDNKVEQLRAHEEMQQASDIRDSVARHLTPDQQRAILDLKYLEENAFDRVMYPYSRAGVARAGGDYLAFVQSVSDMQKGATESKSLDDWLLS